jgi:hypothetical protein
MIKIYYSSIYFKTIAEGLKWGLSRDKTLKIEVIDNVYNDSDLWIILGLQNAKYMPNKYIVWNFEQLEVETEQFDNKFWDRMKNAFEVWDYSKENIKWLEEKHLIKAIHLPLGWCPMMKINSVQTQLWNKRNNTFAFVGLMNERRRDILKSCHMLAKVNNWNMYLSNKCWNNEYDYIYSITKIGLNIHCYSGKTILEVHRIIPLILNKIWVISEHSNDIWYDELFNDIITWSNPENFSNNILEIQQMDDETVMIELDRRQHELIKRCNFSTFLRNINLYEKI